MSASNRAIVVLLVATLTPAAATEPPNPKGVRFFESRIRPILIEHCQDCHSAIYAENDLKLDSFQAMLKGGKSGPALVPGKPDQSLLLKAVSYENPKLQMPPLAKLSDQKIADLRKWIAIGAPHPGPNRPAPRSQTGINFDKARQFWAFQPISRPAAPKVEHSAWPRRPIDRFILARLESKNLAPAPPADKRTLIRRATFDLTGLPPTIAQIEAFLADDSPDAFKTVINRLLASPAYGERWGRHWLDVARYADSNGLDENVAFGNAWKYRDYVVQAFNNDKPYNEFIIEQLAGDLLPYDGYQQRNEHLVATGFLTLGPKLLAEVDKKKLAMDIIDEQIDTTGRAFLGLTLGCARCHDHKFDPILQADYYALAGIFKSTTTMDSLKTIAMWHENPIPTPTDINKQAAHKSKLSQQQKEIEQFIKTANAALLAKLADGAALPKKPETQYPPETKAKLKSLREELEAIKKAAPPMPMAMGVTEAEPVDVAIHIRGSHLSLGKIVPRRLPLVLVSTKEQPAWPDQASGRLALAKWIASPDNPLTARVMVNRIWHWHFGKGLVTTTDNFGKLGDNPSHPKLLDWLATCFIESGWSIKAMHREIMLSSTYRMSNTYNPRSAKLDPANTFLWRFPMRRMEAEELRDSLLAVSGQLNSTIGGSLLKTPNHKHIFNHTSIDNTTYHTNRRSLYLPIVRNHLYTPFILFDYSGASMVMGNRPTSTVAPQALFLMNSDSVIDAAATLADKLLARNSANDTERINILYKKLLARPPEPQEVKRAMRYLKRFTNAFKNHSKKNNPRQAAWMALCQMLLASNEFIYIR